MILEEKGVIRGYHADVDPEKTGLGITCMISINMSAHNEGNAEKLHRLLSRLPNVLEAYAMTGEMDYTIKVVTKDLKELNDFISVRLLRHPTVQNVKTSIVLNTIKQTQTLPLHTPAA